MSYFIGRKDALSKLGKLLQKKKANFVVIKGRRRIGKSRFAEEFAKDKKFFRFSGIPPVSGVTAQDQRNVFAKQLGMQINMPNLTATNWMDLFTLLSRNVKGQKCVILFDEISWMGSEDLTFLGKLKNAWDIEFSKQPELVFIVCGSVSTWIQQNIINSTAFFGRISLCLTLDELPLDESNEFLETLKFRWSSYEKFKLLSVIGGVPWYLEQIEPKLNADENIKSLCLTSYSMLLNEFDMIFHDLFGNKGAIYKKILEFLASGAAELGDISTKLNYPQSGALSEYLNNLIESAFITRDFTWNIEDSKPSRLSHFRLSDNYIRFYLKYILPNKPKILLDGFNDISISSLPEWSAVMGLQFENLVLKNRKKIKSILGLKDADIVVDNPFFQRKNSKQKGCQIDYLIQTRFGTLFACEIKFSKSEIKSGIIPEMKEKLSRLKLPKGFACNPVLIHVNGVEESVEDSGYFAEIIDFGQLLVYN